MTTEKAVDLDQTFVAKLQQKLEELLAKIKATQEFLAWFTSREDFDLRQAASKLAAQTRQSAERRRPPNPADEFITKTLGVFQTTYGDLSRAEVEQLNGIRMRAAQAIQNCQKHDKERCRCWADARTELFELRRRAGEKSAVGMGALAVWNSLEALATTRDRQQEQFPQTNVSGMSPQVQLEVTGRAVNPYNWRFWRSSTYQGYQG